MHNKKPLKKAITKKMVKTKGNFKPFVMLDMDDSSIYLEPNDLLQFNLGETICLADAIQTNLQLQKILL